MVGWSLIFAVLSTVAVVAGTSRGMGFIAATVAALVFVFLLLVSALARVLRGHA